MRIILGIVFFLLVSIWLAIVIGVGVNSGLKAFYKETFKNKKEEK